MNEEEVMFLAAKDHDRESGVTVVVYAVKVGDVIYVLGDEQWKEK